MSKLVKGQNDLLSLFPDIAAEWDYENNEKEPSDYTAGSVQKVCWICSEGHRWQATIKNRTQLHSGCPYCAGQRVITGINDLATVNPDLAVQWHPTKNGALTPAHVKYASIKRVWWLGKCGHTWDDTVTNRNSGNGCPYCAGKRILPRFNDLASKYPEIAKEWHPTENEPITPADVSYGSGKKYYWLCPNGHSYSASVSRRVSGDGCPYCSGHKVLAGYNDLQTLNPELAKEWNYSRNTGSPSEITPNSSKKVWWLCPICGYEWEAAVSNRNRGSRCPQCYKQSSFSEQALMFYLEAAGEKVINRYLELGYELDIFLPERKIAIEYDGIKYHSTPKKIANDTMKDRKCLEFGIQLYRIRENGLPLLPNSVSICRDDDTLIALTHSIIELFDQLHIIADIDVERDELLIIERYRSAFLDNSLAVKYPPVAAEWHPTKNGKLKPENVSTGVNTKVWWLGKCGHEWIATVASRCKGAGCKVCRDKRNAERSSKPEPGKSFGDLCPSLIQEWDNANEKSPFDYKPSSGQSVWWVCSTCSNRWKATIRDRYAGHGCIKCANRIGAQKRSANMRKKVYQYTLSGEYVKEYDCAATAAAALGISVSAIKNACNPKVKLQTAGGYKWSYIKE